MKMKFTSRMFLLIVVSFFNFQGSTAQDKSITDEYKEQAIQVLSQLMNDYYVFPEVAKLTEDHLMILWKKAILTNSRMMKHLPWL